MRTHTRAHGAGKALALVSNLCRMVSGGVQLLRQRNYVLRARRRTQLAASAALLVDRHLGHLYQPLFAPILIFSYYITNWRRVKQGNHSNIPAVFPDNVTKSSKAAKLPPLFLKIRKTAQFFPPQNFSWPYPAALPGAGIRFFLSLRSVQKCCIKRLTFRRQCITIGNRQRPPCFF